MFRQFSGPSFSITIQWANHSWWTPLFPAPHLESKFPEHLDMQATTTTPCPGTLATGSWKAVASKPKDHNSGWRFIGTFFISDFSPYRLVHNTTTMPLCLARQIPLHFLLTDLARFTSMACNSHPVSVRRFNRPITFPDHSLLPKFTSYSHRERVAKSWFDQRY